MEATYFSKPFAAAKSLTFSPSSAQMAVQTSPHGVLSLRTCSSLRNTTSISLLHFRRSSSIQVLFLFDMACYCTYSNDDSCFLSKRRSCGPVMAVKKTSEGAKQEEVRYMHVVDLPKTTFGMRANSSVREPEIQKLYDENQVFKRVADRDNRGTFVLHDGPPYANGDLRMGHALNKILKDIISHYKLRTEMNKVLEVARTEKLIGSSPEAKVCLHTSDDSLATRLNEMCASNNDADTLPRIFITSQVQVMPSTENEWFRDVPYSGEYLIRGKKRV